MTWSDVKFSALPHSSGKWHAAAASENESVVDAARAALLDRLNSTTQSPVTTHLLLKAAAGAGKSFALQQLIVASAGAPGTRRIGVTAFTNNQIRPLAAALTERLGPARVCLHLSQDAARATPTASLKGLTVSTTATSIPASTDVVVATASKLKAFGEVRRLRDHFGATASGHLFTTLFVDEAWQLPHHLFDGIGNVAPLIVGVGDVGQLPPLEVGTNPWRGDEHHNPYRAWPTSFTGKPTTWERELPSVWRPPGEAIGLWRAFYPEWGELNGVAAPGERHVTLEGEVPSGPLWHQVGSGTPTLVEVTGLPESEAPDVDLPLAELLELWLDELFTAGFTVRTARYASDGNPTGETNVQHPGTSDDGDPLIVVLATRNQAVDDATAMVDRLRKKHGLKERDLVSSTVDSWQGRTNAITIAIHPLSGATQLDEFNSAFGRLAVACTRATHGLLVVTRAGLDELLATAPARPGTPFGEPGVRQLPRQTHERILGTFSRAIVDGHH